MRVLRDLADDRRTIKWEGHQPCPCPCHWQLPQEGEHFGGVPMVHLDASDVRALLIVHQLPVASENDFASACLAPIEMSGQPLVSAMGQVGWALGIVSRRGMPVQR